VATIAYFPRSEDYSVVFGVYPASQAVSKTQIGIRWHNVDLVAAGYVNTVRE